MAAIGKMPEKIETGRELVGLLPAAGSAERISPLPCSKEIFPVGFHESSDNFGQRPKAAAHYLLENMQNAGVENAFIVIRKGKWDIPGYFGGGELVPMNIAYMVTDATGGVPFTLDKAYSFYKNDLVLFGFPDIVFKPKNVFKRLLQKQKATEADVVLGLFKSENHRKMDMVKLKDGGISGIVIKPQKSGLVYTWIAAVWTPRFSRFMHEYLHLDLFREQESLLSSSPIERKEIYVGDVIQAAVDINFRVEGVIFKSGIYIDIGTPDDLYKAVKTGLNRKMTVSPNDREKKEFNR